jgi:superfamily I DNA/RNA helicase
VSDKAVPTVGLAANNGVVANALVKLLDAVDGLHPKSFRQGYRQGYQKAGAMKAEPAPTPIVRHDITVRLEDARSDEDPVVRFDGLLLDDGRLSITPSLAKSFQEDALAKLGEDHQPTEEQWKAILAPTTSAVTIGIAGTGKTFVMMMRAIFLHRYLKIPLDEMTVLAVTKDCRFDIVAELTHLFGRWDVSLSQEQSLELVKTPRGALLKIIRAVPPLREVVPFELAGLIDIGDEDGRPFDPRLTAEQLEILDASYQAAYTRSSTFAESIQSLFANTVALPRSSADNPQLIRYSEIGSSRIDSDEALTKAVTGLWHSSGTWPIPEIDASLTTLDVMGRTVHLNGYFPMIGAYVVLGFPKGLARDFKRAGAEMHLFEECLAKRAFIQRFCTDRVIWVDSTDQLASIVTAAASMGDTAPRFAARVKGLDRSMGIAECLYQTGALIETLGMNPAKSIADLRFMPNDPDASFFECAAKFWPMFETYLLGAEPRMMTIDRLFLTFGRHGDKNLKAVPTDALKSMRNVLTDELQDFTIYVGEFIRACMLENRHRIEIEGIEGAVMSVYAAGDDFQTAHGTQGATPKYLTEFKKHFPSKGFALNLLGVNFRSQQGIIFSAHSLILGIPAVSTLAPASSANREDSSPVEVFDLTARTFMSLFDEHYASGKSILILAANPDDYRQSEPFVNVVLDRDKRESPNNRQVRVRAAQRSKGLEADVVFILGDFFAASSSWAKNQIFKSARTVETDDQSPFDVIQQNELYRLAHIGITRARVRCYWLLSKEVADQPPRLKASTRISGVPGSFIDHR